MTTAQGYKSFSQADLKFLPAVATREIPDIKKVLRVSTTDGVVKMALERADGMIGPVKLRSPPLRVVHSMSLNGIGGKAKLQNGKEAEEKFNIVCTDHDLLHEDVYKANPKVDLKAEVAHFKKTLFDIKDAFLKTKAANPSVHPKQYASAVASMKAFGKGLVAGNPDYNEMLVNVMEQASHFGFSEDSKDAENLYGKTGCCEFKFSTNPFYKPKKDDKIRPVNGEIRKVYDAGPVDSNPDYKFAKAVVDKQKEGYNFNKPNITHVDKTVKYPLFGPYFSRDSTVVVEFTVEPFMSGENDGINLYLSGILVLEEEKYVSESHQIPNDYGYVSKKREAETAAEGAGDASSEKRQKTDEAEAGVQNDYST